MIIESYHAHIPDAGTVDEAEPHIIHEGEYDLRISLDWEYGQPVVTVLEVLEGGRNLYDSSDIWVRMLAARVAEYAADDDWVIDQAVQDYTDNREAA